MFADPEGSLEGASEPACTASDDRKNPAPLVCRNRSAIYGVMAHWSARQIFVLVLVVLVTAGLNFSAVPAATAMPEAAKMSMMTGMNGDHGCKQCSNMPGSKAMVCSPICAAPLSASIETESQPLIGQRQGFAALERWLAGLSQPPDPYPPRPFHIV